jgi:hypothetical protein
MREWTTDFVWGLASAYVVFFEWEVLAELAWFPNVVGLVVQAATLVFAWRWRSWRASC